MSSSVSCSAATVVSPRPLATSTRWRSPPERAAKTRLAAQRIRTGVVVAQLSPGLAQMLGVGLVLLGVCRGVPLGFQRRPRFFA